MKKLNVLPNHEDSTKDEQSPVALGRFPSWLHRTLPQGKGLWQVDQEMRKHHLHTVCEEAKCPNRTHCWSQKTATFLVLGKQCTRSCGFCSINFSKAPPPPDPLEPAAVAESVAALQLRHVVITMVARDDLPDGGARHLASVIAAIKERTSDATIEVLTSDFQGNWEAIDIVLQAAPDVFNYNIETVRRLTPRVRHKATYERTLQLLQYLKKSGKSLWIKSGLMVGLGESKEEVIETLQDLHSAGCRIVTMGQYLQSLQNKLLVKEFITPEQFQEYEAIGYDIGIERMYCGPFVRSSFNAGAVFKEASGSAL